MSQRWIRCAFLVVAMHSAAPTWAGYDFEPPSLQSFARFLGIGPGPGYHAVPCIPGATRKHYRCVTRNCSPMPMESDYFPDTRSNFGCISQTASDPFLPYADDILPEAAHPLPDPETIPAPRSEIAAPNRPDVPAPIPPGAPAPPAPARPRILPPPAVPRPPVPRQFPIETRKQTTPVPTLLDELLQEQEVKLREVDEMLNELGPPPLPEVPTNPSAKPISSAGDSWW